MSDMSNLYRAYSAVHSSEVSDQLNESRDLISDMQFNQLNSSDLQEVAEEILEQMFELSLDIEQSSDIIADILSESLKTSQSDLKSQKIDYIGEAFDAALENGHTVERFLGYRRSKKVQENFHNTSNEDRSSKRLHEALIAQERKNIKEGILSLIEKKTKDSSYLETNMKKRAENNEKARKDMEKMGSMKNPQLEEFSQIRQDWSSAYSSIYEKMDPVGKEDGDIDNDGDKDSSDDYLAKRRKAIGKAMGKKGKCEKCGKDSCECDVKESLDVNVLENIYEELIGEGYSEDDAISIMVNMSEGPELRRIGRGIRDFFTGAKKKETKKVDPKVTAQIAKNNAARKAGGDYFGTQTVSGSNKKVSQQPSSSRPPSPLKNQGTGERSAAANNAKQQAAKAAANASRTTSSPSPAPKPKPTGPITSRAAIAGGSKEGSGPKSTASTYRDPSDKKGTSIGRYKTLAQHRAAVAANKMSEDFQGETIEEGEWFGGLKKRAQGAANAYNNSRGVPSPQQINQKRSQSPFAKPSGVSVTQTKKPTPSGVTFSEAELKAIQAKVDAWDVENEITEFVAAPAGSPIDRHSRGISKYDTRTERQIRRDNFAAKRTKMLNQPKTP